MEGYGSSESAGMIKRVAETPPAALGRPAHDGVRVVNPETRETCAPAILDGHGRVTNAEAAVGEIVDVHGAAKFEGYYKNPEADAERVRHGWYWTGDLGYVDADGFLYFGGRSGDWIRVDSENISALHTQNVVRRHPKIVDAVAFGVPDPRSGDRVMAAIEVPPGVRFEDLDFAAFLAAQDDLGTKGAPRFVRVSHALPTTGSGSSREGNCSSTAGAPATPCSGGRGGGARVRPDDRGGQEALRAEFAAAGRRRFLP